MEDLGLNTEIVVEQPEVKFVHGLSEEEIQLFVGKKSEYYIKKWKSSEDLKKRAGWNWAAFLCVFFWLGYRKMYLNALSLVGAFLVIDVIQAITNLSFDRTVGTAIAVSLGMFGNAYYFKHMTNKINKIKESNTDPEIVKKEISKAGGGSWLGVGIVALMFVGYMLVTSVLQGIVISFL